MSDLAKPMQKELERICHKLDMMDEDFTGQSIRELQSAMYDLIAYVAKNTKDDDDE
jgi:hypothetical protein